MSGKAASQMRRVPWPTWGQVSSDEQIIGMIKEQESGMAAPSWSQPGYDLQS